MDHEVSHEHFLSVHEANGVMHNDEHQNEGRKNVFFGFFPSYLGRAMVASFLSTSGLAPNVLYVIRKYAIIRRSDIEWLLCEGFLALLAVLLPLYCIGLCYR